jgi:hypothetical protein
MIEYICTVVVVGAVAMVVAVVVWLAYTVKKIADSIGKIR